MTTCNAIDLSIENLPSPASYSCTTSCTNCYKTSLKMYLDGFSHDAIRAIVRNCKCPQCCQNLPKPECECEKCGSKYVLSINTLGIPSTDIFSSYKELKSSLIEALECAENQDLRIQVVVIEKTS